MKPRAFCVLAAGVVALATSLEVPFARADSTETSIEDRRQAAADFSEGDQAFKDGDYRHAAESYERAYARVPHYSALWNAARSWHRTGELARAANLYARYLREAPPTTRDRNLAQSAMNELAERLARIQIQSADVKDIQVDGQPAALETVFVTPGQHVIAGRSRDGRPVRETKTVAAGDVVSVALVVPQAPEARTVVEPPPAEVSRRGVPPVVVYVGGAAALALTGVTVWSGIDTLQQKDSFDKNPTQTNLDAGREKELRTNVLIGASAGMAALTALTAIFFVRWHKTDAPHDPAPDVQVGAGLGSFVVRGSF
jgi:hypothetical protein